MAISRTSRIPIINRGEQYGTSYVHVIIRKAINDGILPFKEIILQESTRLDILAGQHYGDSSYYWIIASASEIGWPIQLQPGTIVRIPELKSALKLIS